MHLPGNNKAESLNYTHAYFGTGMQADLIVYYDKKSCNRFNRRDYIILWLL